MQEVAFLTELLTSAFLIRDKQTEISGPYVKTIGLILALIALSMVSKGRDRHSI